MKKIRIYLLVSTLYIYPSDTTRQKIVDAGSDDDVELNNQFEIVSNTNQIQLMRKRNSKNTLTAHIKRAQEKHRQQNIINSCCY